MKTFVEKRSFLEKLDFFGIGINIKISNREKHNTRIGGFVTIIMIALMVAFATNLLAQVITKQNPQVLFQQKQISQPKRHDLTPNTFTMAVTLLNNDLLPFFDETIYSIQGQSFRMNKMIDETTGQQVEDVGTIDLKMERCNANHFLEPQSRDYFLSLDYTNMYCIQPGQEQLLFLEGQYDANRFNMLKFNVLECIDNTVCSESTNRKKQLKDTKLQFYYVNSVVDITNLDKPFSRVGQTQFWRTNYDMVQQVNLQFIDTYVQDDMGLFYSEDLFINQDMLFSSERTLQGSRDPAQDRPIYQIEMFMEKNKENIYQRTYMKIPQAVSQIGGIFNVIFALGCILSKPYAELQLQRKIINETFSFNDENDSQKKKESLKESKTALTTEGSPTKLKNRLASVLDLNDYTKNGFHKNSKLFIQSRENLQNQNTQEGNNDNLVVPPATATETNDRDDNKDQAHRKITTDKQIIGLSQYGTNCQIEVSSPTRNTFFNVTPPKQQFNQIQPQNKSISEFQNFAENLQSLKSQGINQEGREDEQNEEESFFKGIFNFVKVGTTDYLKSYFTYFFKSSQSDQLNYCKQKINQLIDIRMMINKSIELSHLKYLLLTHDQQSLFKLIPKPNINKKIIKRNPSMSILVNNFAPSDNSNFKVGTPLNVLQRKSLKELKRMKEAQLAFKNIREATQQDNNLNEKLINMIEKDKLKLMENDKLHTAQEKLFNSQLFKKISFSKSPLATLRRRGETQFFPLKIQNSPRLVQFNQCQNSLRSEVSAASIEEEPSQGIQDIYLQKEIELIAQKSMMKLKEKKEQRIISLDEPNFTHIEGVNISSIIEQFSRINQQQS